MRPRQPGADAGRQSAGARRLCFAALDGDAADHRRIRADQLVAKPGWRPMWLLENETPFAAERTWTRDERGAEFWLVAIRAAFEIDTDGRQRVAQKQTEVQSFPRYAGDPVREEMLSDSDFALSKSGTDVLVGG